MCIEDEHSCSMRAKEEKSQVNSFVFGERERRRREKRAMGKRRRTYRASKVGSGMCAYAVSKKESLKQEEQEEKKGNVNCRQNSRCRPPERPTTKQQEKRDACVCIYFSGCVRVFKLRHEKNEKEKREGGEDEEEGCTYTTAIARARRKDARVFSSVLLCYC